MQINPNIHIEVAYGIPEKQSLIPLSVPRGCTVKEAIKLSGILHQFKEIDLSLNPLGIHSRRVGLSDKVAAGDRVEIYRSLLVEPKQARRQRAKVDLI